jgi:hypothetical protein
MNITLRTFEADTLSASSFAFLTLLLVQLPFPIKLHDMLEGISNNGSQDVVSWQPHGKAFRVHQPEVFARAIMPYYFKQTKYKSFQRQLHIYGFRRINKGRDKGAYYHNLFIQNDKSMSLRMVREKIKGGIAGKKNLGQHEIEAPDFYKGMVVIENHPAYCNSFNQTRRDFTTMSKPAPIKDMVFVENHPGENHPAYRNNFNETRQEFTTMSKPAAPSMANISRVTAKNTDSRGVEGLLDSWLCVAEQDVSSSSFKQNNFPLFTGNIASGVLKERIEDGEEVFFQGKKFHFVESSLPSLPKSPVEENFLAFVTARGPISYMPKCA